MGDYSIMRGLAGVAVAFVVIGIAITLVGSFVLGEFWHPFGDSFNQRFVRAEWAGASLLGLIAGFRDA